MIRAGNFTIDDRGFAVSTEGIGGVSRQTLSLELAAGISDEALEAVCAGPIEVLDSEGNVAQTHEGPFRVLSHGMKLTRTSATHDVSVLSARVAELETALSKEQSTRKSAQEALASLSERFKTLQESIAASIKTGSAEKDTGAAETGDGESGV